jgi:hypothetical protein
LLNVSFIAVSPDRFNYTKKRIASRSFADFMADDTADNRTADGADRAAARKNGASDGTGAGADCRVLTLPRHPGATHHAEEHGCGNCI